MSEIYHTPHAWELISYESRAIGLSKRLFFRWKRGVYNKKMLYFIQKIQQNRANMKEICFNIFVSYLSFTNILLKSVIIQVVKNLAFMFLKIADWSIFIDFRVFCDLASRLGRLIICHQKQSKICLQEKMGSPNRRYFKIIYIPFILHKQEMG